MLEVERRRAATVAFRADRVSTLTTRSCSGSTNRSSAAARRVGSLVVRRRASRSGSIRPSASITPVTTAAASLRIRLAVPPFYEQRQAAPEDVEALEQGLRSTSAVTEDVGVERVAQALQLELGLGHQPEAHADVLELDLMLLPQLLEAEDERAR